MGIETVIWRIGGMLRDQLEYRVELGHPAGCMAVWSAHHSDEESSTGKSVEIIGDRGKRRVGRS